MTTTIDRDTAADTWAALPLRTRLRILLGDAAAALIFAAHETWQTLRGTR